MIDRSGRKVRELHPLRLDPHLSVDIGIAQDRIGVGDIEILADEADAERRLSALPEHAASRRGGAVGVRAQQGDAIGACRPGAGQRHHQTHHQILGPLDDFARSVAFDDQNIAIGQNIQGARMFEPSCERAECEIE